MVSLLDLPATILSAAGIAIPSSIRGNPLQKLMGSRQPSGWPEEVFLQISESQCGRAIRTKRWKYSVRAPEKSGQDPSSDRYVEEFLYDLEADPHERNNLVSDPAFSGIRLELSATLKRRMVEAGEQEPEIVANLRKLNNSSKRNKALSPFHYSSSWCRIMDKASIE